MCVNLSVYKCLVTQLGTRKYSVYSFLSISLFPLSFPLALPQETFLKRYVRKMVYGVFRSIWQCKWDCGNTASDLAISLFRFRHSASSSGLVALLAKPQSNHLNLLCALRGYPVTLSEALNMCGTIHVRPRQ